MTSPLARARASTPHLGIGDRAGRAADGLVPEAITCSALPQHARQGAGKRLGAHHQDQQRAGLSQSSVTRRSCAPDRSLAVRSQAAPASAGSPRPF